jgi:hypothetical protein
MTMVGGKVIYSAISRVLLSANLESENVSVLAEGFDGWLKHRYPVETRGP